jgi:hypothetical protein
MSDQDGLTQQDFDDLIRRLSQRKQESPRDRIPFQDVKDILQDEGLLESLLKEHVNGSNHSLKESEQRHRKQKSLLTKSFAAISVVLVGVSAWGGYMMGHQMTVDSMGKLSLSTQEKLNGQIQSLETRFFDLQGSEYRANFTQLGSRIDNSGCTVETSLIKEVPVKAFLVFNDIPLDVKKIKALEVSVSVKSENNTQWMNPQYREITVR